MLSFENAADRTSHAIYYLPKVHIKDYNVAIDGKNIFDQPIKSYRKAFESIKKITIGQGDDYNTLLPRLYLF